MKKYAAEWSHQQIGKRLSHKSQSASSFLLHSARVDAVRISQLSANTL